MKDLSGRIGSPDQDIYHVHFEDGSRTALHAHNGNQVLIATRGRGSLEVFERAGRGRGSFAIRRMSRTALAEGDIVHIPAGTLHAHGSVQRRGEFSHIAINIPPRRGAAYRTTWYESDLAREVTGVI